MTTRELVEALDWALGQLDDDPCPDFQAAKWRATEVLASGKRYLESDRRFREAQALVEGWERDKESVRVIAGKESKP